MEVLQGWDGEGVGFGKEEAVRWGKGVLTLRAVIQECTHADL